MGHTHKSANKDSSLLGIARFHFDERPNARRVFPRLCAVVGVPEVGRRWALPPRTTETMLFSRGQGKDGTRVFTVSSVLDLVEGERCQARPRLFPAPSTGYTPAPYLGN